jgi:hypothetical protein
MSQLPTQVLTQTLGGAFNNNSLTQGINPMNQPQYNQIPQQTQESN